MGSTPCNGMDELFPEDGPFSEGKMIKTGAVFAALLEECRVVLDQTDFVANSFGKDVHIPPLAKSLVGAADFVVETLDCTARACRNKVKMEMCPMKYASAAADALECLDDLAGLNQAANTAQTAVAPPATQAAAWGPNPVARPVAQGLKGTNTALTPAGTSPAGQAGAWGEKKPGEQLFAQPVAATGPAVPAVAASPSAQEMRSFQ